jgi:hypothetical protein
MTPPLDFSPLTTGAITKRSPQQAAMAGLNRAKARLARLVLLMFVVALVVGVVLAVAKGNENVELTGIFVGFVAVLVGIGCAIGALFARRRHGRTDRFLAFVAANGLDGVAAPGTEPLPGTMITPAAQSRTTTYKVQLVKDGLPVEIATYSRYSSGGRSGGSTTTFQYLAIHHRLVLPYIAFESGRLGRPTSTLRGELLTQVNESAGRGAPRLYAAPGGRGRAEGVFTPEIIALLREGKSPCNAEMIDGYFFAYFPGMGDLKEGRWRHLFAVAEAVTARLGELVAAAQ